MAQSLRLLLLPPILVETANQPSIDLFVDVLCVLYCSWAGILDLNQHMVRLAETLWEWDKFRQQWKGTDVLLVDEISMVGADLMEKVN